MKLNLSLCGALFVALLLLLPADARGDVLVMTDGATHDPVWVDSATFAGGMVQFSVRPLDGSTGPWPRVALASCKWQRAPGPAAGSRQSPGVVLARPAKAP